MPKLIALRIPKHALSSNESALPYLLCPREDSSGRGRFRRSNSIDPCKGLQAEECLHESNFQLFQGRVKRVRSPLAKTRLRQVVRRQGIEIRDPTRATMRLCKLNEPQENHRNEYSLISLLFIRNKLIKKKSPP